MSDDQLKSALNRANPNTLADGMRRISVGSVLRGQIPQVVRQADPAADAAQLGTLEAIVLPNDAKASAILRATGRAGTVNGEFTPQVYGTTPATTQIAVAPNGDVVVLAADAITDLDFTYVPERGDVVVLENWPVDAATGILTLPTALAARGVILLIDANVITATAGTGRRGILVPGATNPATTKARLKTPTKELVYFTVADAVTKATVTLLVCAEADLGDRLEETTGIS